MRQELYANHKGSLDWKRVDEYVAGGNVYPRTVEMDLSTYCTRKCPACPTTSGSGPVRSLTPAYVDRLLGILEGNTKGIIMSGGEPTASPYFSEILAIARRRGFVEIAVISNGSELGKPNVQDLLLERATSVRVSLYDWHNEDKPAAYFTRQVERISALRRRIDDEASRLEVGAAILTSRERIPRMIAAAHRAAEAGAHWIYFHPLCEHWREGRPIQCDQEGVLESIAKFRETERPGVEVYVPEQRYTRYPLRFSRFHAAHFLLQISADGVNYASPEAKYQPSCAILDLNEYMGDDFLWHPARQAAIRNLTSDVYAFAGTRHRGSMFSDFLERYSQGSEPEVTLSRTATERDFHHPHIC
jgi:MoaA/NifB/PqqE/SkfB family radical SAM enzyme